MARLPSLPPPKSQTRQCDVLKTHAGMDQVQKPVAVALGRMTNGVHEFCNSGAQVTQEAPLSMSR